jgi:hypothetical protein
LGCRHEQPYARAFAEPAGEREPVWEEQKRRCPGFAGHEKKTDRVIPVVLLTRR